MEQQLNNPVPTPCKYGFACRNILKEGEKQCPFLHTDREKVEAKLVTEEKKANNKNPIFAPCKYGAECYSKSCKFEHPPKPTTVFSPSNPNLSFCRYGQNCYTENCSFRHSTSETIPCKYGLECHNKQCLFIHPLQKMNQQISGKPMTNYQRERRPQQNLGRQINHNQPGFDRQPNHTSPKNPF